MSQSLRVTNEQVIEAYKATGSVWKAAKQLGICGQSMWERLKRIGYTMSNERWTGDEVNELIDLASSCTLSELARRLGRTYASVACKVSELHLGVRFGNRRQPKVKRGSGLTKPVIHKYAQELARFGGSARQFAIQRGLDLNLLVIAFQVYEREFWDGYVAAHSDLSPIPCPQCGRRFIPLTAKQTACSRRCRENYARDQKYFGGKRKFTVGINEGVCQLCGKEKRSLSSHHVFGKENDPENDCLIALCSGCHQLVTHLGARKDLGNPEFLEGLISLAMARHHGGKKPIGYHVCVDVEELTEEPEG